MRLIRAWRERRNCFHHNPTNGASWVTRGQLIDLGRRKLYKCVECRKVWII